MSGHSKWSTIKHKKGKADAARSKVFSRISKEITIAAKMGGGDPDANPRLRTALANARAVSFPRDNIDTAIKKGTGELEGVNYEEYNIEGYGPQGIAVIYEGLTDNTNRTIAEVRSIFAKNGGNMATTGAVSYMFDRVGEIVFDKEIMSEEEMEEMAIEAGAEDVILDDEEVYIVRTAIGDLQEVASFFEEKGIEYKNADMNLVPQNVVELKGAAAESAMKFYEKMEDQDDCQKLYTNFVVVDEE